MDTESETGRSERLTTAEVAQLYRTTPETIRFWRHTGYGPQGVKYGRRVLYTRAALAEFDRKRELEETEGAA